MRIISQNGMIDVPYEQISIEIKENEIWCGYYATLEQHCIAKKFARYSAEAKAKKAMEMLHQKYNDMHFVSITGNSNELKIAASLLTKNAFNEITNPYFQFPADEDVEV